MTDSNESGLLKIIFNDFITFLKELFNGTLFTNLRRDYKDLKEFFFDKYRREKLEKTNPVSRFFIAIFWFLKMLLIKLAAFRRILVVVALVFLVSSLGGSNNQSKIFLGVLFLLFVILLELKDKLLARQELEAGRSIQQALMPENNPKVPGWDVWLVSEPANDVGGDLIDFFMLGKNKYAISIGDVAGKGLAAALLMAKLQATLRALLTETITLPELGEQINLIFFRDSLPERFASLCVFRLQKGGGDISIVNAGHIPPIIVKGNKLSEMQKGETALGLISNTRYQEQIVHLDIGEFLFCYSDGVCEARNDKDQFFTEHTLHRFLLDNCNLSSSDLGKGLLDTLHEFIGETPQFDDISFIIIKRKN